MKIKNVMLDGTVRDSMKGVIIPTDHPVYKALMRVLIEKRDKVPFKDKESAAG